MKTSIDLFNEYIEKHGQKAVEGVTGASQPLVSKWKARGGMTPAATVKVGLALGYDIDFLSKISALEAERTEAGRSFLEALLTTTTTNNSNGEWRKR